MTLKIPQPIRRFQSMKISTTKILLIGGLGASSQELDAVFCLDLEKEYTIEELDKIDRAGIVDYPIVLDQIGNLHLYLETRQDHVQLRMNLSRPIFIKKIKLLYK